MSDIAISVENISKRYRIGRAQQRHDTLRDAIVAGLQAPLSRWRSNGRHAEDNTIWALKDVSFEVEQGEVVGVIGRNGAGKSTLLKILSQITEPTSGRAVINGRVGSLLEVGTGFHPELTGRENIYLNGAILGMRRDEIRRQFDEIVAFSEIEKFLDTPVKRYSSGMYVRLAFAVAAHLEPEILVVDEVLAVGDARFQQKCLGKMQDVSSSGRTVLFVSHNMGAIQRLCSRAILLVNGEVTGNDDARLIVPRYLADSSMVDPPESWIDLAAVDRKGSGSAQFVGLSYTSHSDSLKGRPYVDGPIEFLLDIVSDSPREISSLAVTFYDQQGTKLVNADSVSNGSVIRLQSGHNLVRVKIQHLHLNPGIYRVGLWLAQPPATVYDYIVSAVKVEIHEPEGAGLGTKPISDGLVSCEFETTYEIQLP